MYQINNLGAQALVNFLILLGGKDANFTVLHKGTRSETCSMTFAATKSELEMVKLLGSESERLVKLSDGGIEEADAQSVEHLKSMM